MPTMSMPISIRGISIDSRKSNMASDFFTEAMYFLYYCVLGVGVAAREYRVGALV